MSKHNPKTDSKQKTLNLWKDLYNLQKELLEKAVDELIEAKETIKRERTKSLRDFAIVSHEFQELKIKNNIAIDSLRIINASDWKTSGELRSIARITLQHLTTQTQTKKNQ
jgi:hypothetical protein